VVHLLVVKGGLVEGQQFSLFPGQAGGGGRGGDQAEVSALTKVFCPRHMSLQHLPMQIILSGKQLIFNNLNNILNLGTTGGKYM
jgi:hypothetical protein